jgi:hypothetical protein
LLETQRDLLSAHIPNRSSLTIESPGINFSHVASQIQSTPGSLPHSEDRFANDIPQSDAETLLESLEISGRSPGASEDILEWPIFEGRYNGSNIETLIFNPQSAADNRTAVVHNTPRDPHIHHSPSLIRSSKPSRGIQEDDVLPLINKFLTNVHIKNPVLDADDLKDKAKLIIENGFSWDATSCLVVSVTTPQSYTVLDANSPESLWYVP